MKDQSWPILVVIMFVVIPWASDFTVAGVSLIPGDFEPDNYVDWADFAVLSAAWQTQSGEAAWNHACDISDPNDGVIDMLDVLVFSRHWLANTPLGMVFIDAGEFEMGDHYDVGASDERPVHTVYVDSFCIGTYEVTNQQYCDYLNSALLDNLIEVGDGQVVYKFGDTEPYCDTNGTNPIGESRILWDGNTFGVVSGKEDHPMVRVTWYGAVAYCNWLSAREGRPKCYDLSTWECNFAANSYRLPTEAEWEYAARGGLQYYKYPWGNDPNDTSKANWELSGDPYESGSYPYTTPVGYYQANGYGVYDMVGNVWEWCNDRYSDIYYSSYPYYNPHGPDTGVFYSFRGGCLQYDHLTSRIAHRGRNARQTRQSYGGFRTVLSFLPVPNVAYWTMDDNDSNTVVTDIVGANDGTARQNTSVLHTNGRINGALTFNGTTDYIDLGSPVALDDLPADDFTVSAWIYDVSTTGKGIIIGVFPDSTAGWILRKQGIGENLYIDFWAGYSTVDAYFATPAGSLESDNWHHVAAVWDADSKTCKIYIDGFESSYVTNTPGGGSYNSDAPFDKEMGRMAYTGGLQFFDGKIDDVKIFNRALSEIEVLRLAITF